MGTASDRGYEGRGRWRRRQLLRQSLLAGAGLAGAFLVACGGRRSATTGSATAPMPPAAPAATTGTPTPKRGGRLVYVGPNNPPHLDPHLTASVYTQGGPIGACYSRLIAPKSFGTKGAFVPEPDLAEKWEQVDATTYIFHIRRNARFHNISPVNGRPATAEDVLYSFARQRATATNAPLLADIARWQTTDAYTLRLDLAEPNADFLQKLADARNLVLAREAVEQKGDIKEGPVIGTGPWIFKELRQGISVTSVRNPDYFISGLPYTDELTNVITNDPAAMVAQFHAGEIIFVSDQYAPRETVEQLVAEKKGVLYEGYSQPYWQILNQESQAVFRDVRVRRALQMAVDRNFIAQQLFSGRSRLQAIITPLPDEWRLSEEELKQSLAYNKEEARRLIAAAGGLPRMENICWEPPVNINIAQLVQQYYKDIGFEVVIKPVDGVTMETNVYRRSRPFALSQAPARQNFYVTGDLEAFYRSDGINNGANINDPELDNLISAQKREFDRNKRGELIKQIQRRVLDQAYYPIIVAPISISAIQPWLRNYDPPFVAAGNMRHYAEMWIDR